MRKIGRRIKLLEMGLLTHLHPLTAGSDFTVDGHGCPTSMPSCPGQSVIGGYLVLREELLFICESLDDMQVIFEANPNVDWYSGTYRGLE